MGTLRKDNYIQCHAKGKYLLIKEIPLDLNKGKKSKIVDNYLNKYKWEVELNKYNDKYHTFKSELFIAKIIESNSDNKNFLLIISLNLSSGREIVQRLVNETTLNKCKELSIKLIGYMEEANKSKENIYFAKPLIIYY